MSQMNLDYDPADLPMDVTPAPLAPPELSLAHFPSVFDDILADVPYPDVPPVIRVQPPTLYVFDDSGARKAAPLATGCLDYFPDALWAVAELSFLGNEKHNPGEPLHDARGKSGDDADALLRHLKDRGKLDTIIVNGVARTVRHSAAVAWRALRLLQREIEADGAERARAAKE